MVLFKPFVLDNWVRQFKHLAQLSLHDTCVDPLSVEELSKLNAVSSGAKESPIGLSSQLIYGSVLGNPELRERILSLYRDDLDNDSKSVPLAITQGGISANFLVLNTLLGPGDHVICQYPTYQQLYDVPRHAGAEVSLWRSRAENEWIPDVSKLTSLVKENTKMIIVNTPNNPTGAVIPRAAMEEIVTFAAQRNIIVFSDEVFRPLYHDQETADQQSIMSFAKDYQNIIATSSLSKAFSLPGIRVGWAISPSPELLEPVIIARDFTTISVSQVDQSIATYALGVQDEILRRSKSICERNLNLLEQFVKSHATRLQWVKPRGGSAAFVRVVHPKTGAAVDDGVLCEKMIHEKGLLIVPGGKNFGTESDDDFKGYLRVGFVCNPEKFEKGLGAWGEYLHALDAEDA
ncbi:aspartate aminotransferase [Penicillium hispanicum]|uniref:aspartate aminotransferase n=1 Tax=Penicillium hispanicum TaxID=1080232 RepID=UPI0025417EA5|nr:aspartate aminotransferase [Penicillium hispanicum]KAJ5584387.1 aspartate aminotransferase [Penicillium hispanicum]